MFAEKKHHTEEPVVSDYINQRCTATYLGPLNGTSSPGVTVRIIVYLTKDYIKNDAVLKLIKHDHQGYKKNFQDFYDREIISECSEGYKNNCYYKWISEKYVVSISTKYTPLPEQLKQDYLTKYPPTEKFLASDFNEQKVIHKELEKNFEYIYYLDDYRGWLTRRINKLREFSAIHLQCKSELQIRCWTGMTEKDRKVSCPTAMMLDDSERMEKWKELEKQAQKNKVVIKNVPWENMEGTGCPHSDSHIEKTIGDKLGIDEEIIERLSHPFPH